MSQVVSSSARSILVCSSASETRRYASEILRRSGFHVFEAASGEEAMGMIGKSSIDLILLGSPLGQPPAMTFEAVIEQIRAVEAYVPVIALGPPLAFEASSTAASGLGSVDMISILDAGADDYFPSSPDAGIFLARVRTQLRIKAHLDQLIAANGHLRGLVEIDDLTGLLNMRGIYDRLDNEIYRIRRYGGGGVCAVMMDLDDFKVVNDTNDHLFGSFVLSTVGKLIKDTIRQVDIAARFGGDEFLIILAETNQNGGKAFSDRIRSRIEQQIFEKDAASIRLSASFGVAFTDGGDPRIDATTLVRQADHALYDAKHAGKNRVRIFRKLRSASAPSAAPDLPVTHRQRVRKISGS